MQKELSIIKNYVRISHLKKIKKLKYYFMKKQINIIAIFIFILTTFSSCTVIGDIFKAGMGVGIFAVVVVIGIILFVISQIVKK